MDDHVGPWSLAGRSFGAIPPPIGLRLEQIVAWLGSLPSPWRWLSDHLTFDASHYRRIRVCSAPEVEVLLLAWLPGQGTDVHAHGGSVGALRLLVGSLEERRYATSRRGFIEVGRKIHRAPAVLQEDRSIVHRIEAIGPGPALSVHVYSPPLSRGTDR